MHRCLLGYFRAISYQLSAIRTFLYANEMMTTDSLKLAAHS
ncbi:hypothetical protein JCM19231_3435 [Vibrio ishigakensis]|uniref:Uncharacterized protein n=1 Tax=Vibrio ishigakensis TaxID=1481914 RepID=A0A0B8NYZ8_9VIBR|nr:hypothetical protein JCM19231_3435 [Vibrio ishigakensis]GAM72408.1 hypothetical protein JCM19236_1208 [Vibrio sp. JCM 19236]